MLSLAHQGPVLVIGDVMLDRYVHGHAGRLSPEAPVPVLAWRRDQHLAGGAANVAANVATLGGRTVLVGVVGQDDMARSLLETLDAFGQGVAVSFVADAKRPTTLKPRFVSNGQQLLRLDREGSGAITLDIEAEVLA